MAAKYYNGLFAKDLKVVNLGNEGFAEEIRSAGAAAVHLEWQPAAQGKTELIRILEKFEHDSRVQAANEEALKRVNAGQPVLVDVALRALDVVPGMTENSIFHAGPPITWDRMSGPLRGAIIGALIYEGKAQTEAEAIQLAESGAIKFGPCHEHDAVGPMAGVLSPSMPVFIIENKTFGNKAYCSLNEGLGKVLRFGAYGPEVIERLKFMQDVIAPALKKAVAKSGGIDIKTLIAQALHMGDEVHNRNKAATSLFIRALIPYVLEAGLEPEEAGHLVNFINGNDHFFLNLSMPACKAILEAANGIPYSTFVTTMARNGTDFGIKVSGLTGQWFTAPAQMIEGLLFPGFTPDDRNPDIGDSAITETCGVGGFAMAAAIAIVQFVGGQPADALEYSNKMYKITVGQSTSFSIPMLDFRGTATGVDILKVIETGILPQINTGIAHKNAGVGQVGAGLVNPPWECFEKALAAFSQAYN